MRQMILLDPLVRTLSNAHMFSVSAPIQKRQKIKVRQGALLVVPTGIRSNMSSEVGERQY